MGRLRSGILLIAATILALVSPLSAKDSDAVAADKAYKRGDYAAAKELWQTDCRAGNLQSCYELGIVYRDGEGVEPDRDRYLSLIQQACEGGIAVGCYQLGHETMRPLEEGTGAVPSEERERGIAFYEKACGLGFSSGCTNLGLHLANGNAPEQDKPVIAERLDAACAVGSGSACFAYAALWDIHEGTPEREDPELANEALQRGCNRLHWDSCQNLAWHYAHGYGAKIDYVRSAALYQLACGDNAAMSCMFVPSAHRSSPPYKGREIHKNFREAGGAYKRACDADFAPGCFGLARLIAMSGNGKSDSAMMRGLLEKAVRLDPDNMAAKDLIGRLERGDVPDRPIL